MDQKGYAKKNKLLKCADMFEVLYNGFSKMAQFFSIVIIYHPNIKVFKCSIKLMNQLVYEGTYEYNQIEQITTANAVTSKK